jgi:hypothetical protein
MACEQVESLGTDVRAWIEFGHEREVRAWMEGHGQWVRTAWRTLKAQHWQNNIGKHSVITCSTFVPYSAFETKKL